MPGKAPVAALEGERQLDALRMRGHLGGVIKPHRAMVGAPWSAGRLLAALILTAGGIAGYLAALPWLGRFWQLLLTRGRDFLGLELPIGEQALTLPGGMALSLPVVATVTPLPDARALGIAGAACAVVLLLSILLPQRFTPLRYFLRLLVLVQATAILFFAVSPEPFPYRLEDHVFVLLTAGLVVLGLVPLLLGLTLHVFDLSLWRKLLVTLMVPLHLALFLPLKILVHVWLVLKGTALLMPLLFLVFGLLLDVFVFVAFYGWALSWRGSLDGRDAAPPVRFQ